MTYSLRSGFEAGYELNAIQRMAAVTTPSRWRDMMVTAVGADGWIDLVDVDTQAQSRAWHYESTGVSVGEPVSLHGQYSVLAVGQALFSVRVARL
jgi:hypothetical protein